MKVIAVNEKVSYLGAENRYESMILYEKSGRMVSKQNHDKNYEAIPDTLRQLQTQKSFDSVSVYHRKMFEVEGNVDTQVILLEKNAIDFTKTYLNERNRPFSDLEIKHLQQTAENVRTMKLHRGVNLLERTRFEANFKEFLTDSDVKTSMSLPQKQTIKPHK